MDLFASAIEEEDATLRFGGGSFRSRALEATYAAERLPEWRRLARILYSVSALLNLAFLAVDWHVARPSRFWIAMPAHAAVILIALAALGMTHRTVGRAALTATLIGWMAATAVGVAVLVSSHGLLAQFVVVMLPVAYYLIAPLPLGWSVACGAFSSAMLLGGYCVGLPLTITEAGLVLCTLLVNFVMAMAVGRMSGHVRRGWAAARAAQRLGHELSIGRAALARIFLASPVPLVLTETEGGRIKALSDSAAALLGDDAPATLRQHYAPAGLDPLAVALAMDGGHTEMEVTAMLDGRPRTLLLKAATIELPNGPAVLTGILDITERKAVQVNLEQIAATDALTGLRNRLNFSATARATMARAARARAPLCLLMIDIDHFKIINDTHGHGAGDAVLRDFGGRCLRSMGADAVVGRMGGEEFAALLPYSEPGAFRRAEQLRAAVAAARIACGDIGIGITISIGITRILPGERDLDCALARADEVLYAAKRSGRNRVMTDEDPAWDCAVG